MSGVLSGVDDTGRLIGTVNAVDKDTDAVSITAMVLWTDVPVGESPVLGDDEYDREYELDCNGWPVEITHDEMVDWLHGRPIERLVNEAESDPRND